MPAILTAREEDEGPETQTLKLVKEEKEEEGEEVAKQEGEDEGIDGKGQS